jgi:hypothetical protein
MLAIVALYGTSGLLQHTALCAKGLQESKAEEDTHDCPLFQGEIQFPELGQWQDTQEEVCGDVEARRDVEEPDDIDALLAFQRKLPGTSYWRALENGDNNGADPNCSAKRSRDIYQLSKGIVGENS